MKRNGHEIKPFADLCGADLCDADLCGADLRDANLRGADLRDAKLPHYVRLPAGTLRVFKKACTDGENVVVELEVPEDALRASALTGPKCRVSKARVVRLLTTTGEPADASEAFSDYDHGFVYRPGADVTVADFDPDNRVECTRGIHCFPTFEEASAYCF